MNSSTPQFSPSANSSLSIFAPNLTTLKQQITLIDDFGLISTDIDTYKPRFGSHQQRNTNSIKIADFWGRRSVKHVIVTSQLCIAAQHLKYKYWKGAEKKRRLGNSPILPHKLDQLFCLSDREKDKKLFRVYSPQLSIDLKEPAKCDKLHMIDEIIKSCDKCRNEGSKVKGFGIRKGCRKRLTVQGKVNIVNKMRILDHRFTEFSK